MRVQSPNGGNYQGWSVRSSSILVFILSNLTTGNVVILYTPEPEGFEATQRLASNVGNGRGIADYPRISGAYGGLPAAPPPGYQPTRVTSFSGAEMISTFNARPGTGGQAAGRGPARDH